MDSFWSGLFNRLGRVNWLAKIRTTQLYHDTPKVINRYMHYAYLSEILYTIKKAFRYSRPLPGCHLPNSSWIIFDVIIPAQGEFGKSHPGWGWEYRKAFFTV
jgi:hypothetical protein